MDEVTKCRYIDCVDTQEKEQILHELPVCDISLCVKWLTNSGHVDLIGRDLDSLRSMKFFVCNNHFTEDCYLSKGTLKENAVPSPHWNNASKKNRGSQFRCMVRLNGAEEHSTTVPLSSRFVGRNGLSVLARPNELEVDEWCRTCATQKLDLVSMTSKSKGSEMTLLSKLKLLIEVDDEDALPTKMCDECVEKLEQSFKFFQQIYVADNTLRQVFPKITTTKANHILPFREKSKSSGTPGVYSSRSEQEPAAMEWNAVPREEGLKDRVTRYYRGSFARGRRPRGRPRGRGFASRVKQAKFNSNLGSHNWLPIDRTANDQLITENEAPFGAGATVFSLLTDTCRSDEELNWVDVLNAISRQESSRPGRTAHRGTETPQIQCEFCQSSFRFRRQLRSHLLAHHSRLSSYMCADCVACYDSESLLLAHRALRHARENYRCDYCLEEFVQKRKLREHISESHLREARYSCEFCLETFEGGRVLEEHVENRHRASAGKCSPNENINSSQSDTAKATDTADVVCPSKLENPADPGQQKIDSFTADVATNPEIYPRTVPCESSCSQSVQDADRQTEGSENGSAVLVECPECCQKLENPEKLALHRMHRHSVKRTELECLLCEKKTFSSIEEYDGHVLDHAKVEAGPW